MSLKMPGMLVILPQCSVPKKEHIFKIVKTLKGLLEINMHKTLRQRKRLRTRGTSPILNERKRLRTKGINLASMSVNAQFEGTTTGVVLLCYYTEKVHITVLLPLKLQLN